MRPLTDVHTACVQADREDDALLNPYRVEAKYPPQGEAIGWVVVVWYNGASQCGTIRVRDGRVYLCKPGVWCSDTGCRSLPHRHFATVDPGEGCTAIPLAVWRAVHSTFRGSWPEHITVQMQAADLDAATQPLVDALLATHNPTREEEPG